MTREAQISEVVLSIGLETVGEEIAQRLQGSRRKAKRERQKNKDWKRICSSRFKRCNGCFSKSSSLKKRRDGLSLRI